MSRRRVQSVPWFLILAGLLVTNAGSACSSNGGPRDGFIEDSGLPEDANVHEDAPPEVPPDVDADDGRVDADIDADVDSDGRDADQGEADTADGDGDVTDGDETDADADTGLPVGCGFVRPTTDVAYGWSGRNSIDSGRFVWRWIDSSVPPDESVLMVRDLPSATDREVLRRTYPAVVSIPSMHGNFVHFFSETLASDADSAEIFRVSLSGGAETRLTVNSSADALPISGDTFVVYRSSYVDPEAGTVYEYRYYDLSDGSEHVISPRGPASEFAFDGYRWVAFTGEMGVDVYKFDLLDPGAGPRHVGPDSLETEGMGFDRNTGILVITTYRPGVSDDWRIEAWDLATDTTSVVLDEPWSQIVPDVDGHVVAYQDSQAAGESYWAHQRSEVRIVDRDTGATRVVMPLDTYYGVGIWERWIAVNNYGMYGDSLITCDLVEGGYMSADLHVIPE